MHINRTSCSHLIQVLNTFWRPKHYLCSQMYNPCSNPHTWSWVLGNDQKHKMVKYKWLKWVSFEGSSAELLRKQSCYSSTSRGDTVRHLARMPPESLPGGHCFRHAHQGRRPQARPWRGRDYISGLVWEYLGQEGGSSQEEDFPEAATPVTQTGTEEQCTNF